MWASLNQTLKTTFVHTKILIEGIILDTNGYKQNYVARDLLNPAQKKTIKRSIN